MARLALFRWHPRPPFLHPLLPAARSRPSVPVLPSVPAPSDPPAGNSWPASRRRVDGPDARPRRIQQPPRVEVGPGGGLAAEVEKRIVGWGPGIPVRCGGGGGGVNPVPSRALRSFVAFFYKALCPKVLVPCVVKLLVFFGVSNFVAHGSH